MPSCIIERLVWRPAETSTLILVAGVKPPWLLPLSRLSWPYPTSSTRSAGSGALDDPAVPPDGLAVGTDLRSWKAKGRPVPMAEALRALDAGGPGAVIEMAEAGS
jgi:hypothetical protein